MRTLQDFIDDEFRAEDAKISANFAARQKAQGGLHGWAMPDLYIGYTRDQLTGFAQKKFDAHVAFVKSPEGQFLEALSESDRLTVEMHRHMQDARAAFSRSWVGELAHIEAAMSKVQALARKITELAIDAQIECAIASKKLDKEPQQ